MLTIRQERAADAAAREALLDAAYGPSRFQKPSQRLRVGRNPARGLAFVAIIGGRIVGTVRLWEVAAGPDRPALLLGPLAVAPDHQRCGIGSALMEHALAAAARRGHGAVLLVGDLAYYSRFGFSAEHTGRLWLPGLTDKGRLLGCELAPDALKGVRGAIRAPKRPVRSPLAAAMAGLGRPTSPQAA
jgi:predicted N-acetyltransferase YhbS